MAIDWQSRLKAMTDDRKSLQSSGKRTIHNPPCAPVRLDKAGNITDRKGNGKLGTSFQAFESGNVAGGMAAARRYHSDNMANPHDGKARASAEFMRKGRHLTVEQRKARKDQLKLLKDQLTLAKALGLV